MWMEGRKHNPGPFTFTFLILSFTTFSTCFPATKLSNFHLHVYILHAHSSYQFYLRIYFCYMHLPRNEIQYSKSSLLQLSCNLCNYCAICAWCLFISSVFLSRFRHPRCREGEATTYARREGRNRRSSLVHICSNARRQKEARVVMFYLLILQFPTSANICQYVPLPPHIFPLGVNLFAHYRRLWVRRMRDCLPSHNITNCSCCLIQYDKTANITVPAATARRP